MSPAIVVPWRGGDPEREASWAWCRKWWEQFGWPIYEVEHLGPEPFNRSWCINEGARRAGEFDCLIVADADVFEDDAERLRDGVESCMDTGMLTIPHRFGRDLTVEGTAKLLSGQDDWYELAGVRDPCTSRVWLMRSDLFHLIGGFDARHKGWGHEDISAWYAALTYRGVTQFREGSCIHLWHKPSLQQAKMSNDWSEGKQLSERYGNALRNGPITMGRLLNERKASERFMQPGHKATHIDMVVISAGRQDYIAATIDSFESNVHGPIVRRTIQDDSGSARFNRWLRRVYPGWDIHTTPGKLGYTGAMRSIWDYERGREDGSPFIFHLEEDFTFDREVNLSEMVAVLEHDETLAQVALLRGPWAPAEIRAGGIIEERPETYEHLDADGIPYLRHRNFWTTNPCVYRRSLMDDGWPNTRGSEQNFGRSQWAQGRFAAFIGDGTPWVTHIGDVRVGIGY